MAIKYQLQLLLPLQNKIQNHCYLEWRFCRLSSNQVFVNSTPHVLLHGPFSCIYPLFLILPNSTTKIGLSSFSLSTSFSSYSVLWSCLSRLLTFGTLFGCPFCKLSIAKRIQSKKIVKIELYYSWIFFAVFFIVFKILVLLFYAKQEKWKKVCVDTLINSWMFFTWFWIWMT